MVYTDLSACLSLLFSGSHSRTVAALARDLNAITLSIIHRLQIENGIIRSLHDPPRAKECRAAILLWRQYLAEEVFQIVPMDLESAFVQAATWNAADTNPPKWSLLIHAAIAVTSDCTFLSLDPALRKLVLKTGGTVLPKTL